MTGNFAPRPFSIPNFRYLWFARLMSMVALYALLLIMGWQAYNLARADMGIGASAGILGLLGPIVAIVGGGAAAIAITGLWSRILSQLGAAKTLAPPARGSASDGIRSARGLNRI